MLSPFEKQLLDSFILGRTEGRESAILADELAAAKLSFASFAVPLDGMMISKALRAAGFNRDYNEGPRKGDPIVYRRRFT